MRVPKTTKMEAVDELVAFLNFDLSHHAYRPPLLCGPVQSDSWRSRYPSLPPDFGGKAISEPDVPNWPGKPGKGPLSAEKFVRELRKLERFAKWRVGDYVSPPETPERGMAVQGYAMQEAFIFILDGLASAKNADEVADGMQLVGNFLNNYLSFDGWLEVPPVTWTIEPKAGTNKKPADWRLTPQPRDHDAYPVILTVVAEATVRGGLVNLRRCALEECHRFFVRKKQRGTRAVFCTNSCRNRYYNVKRITEKRREDKYNEMLLLARRKIPLTEGQVRKVEKFMGMDEFERFRAVLRSGNPKPRVSDETRTRFAAPRPRARPAR